MPGVLSWDRAYISFNVCGILATRFSVMASARDFVSDMYLHQYLVYLLSGASTTPKRCEK